jgi:hypothetical protein
MYVAEGRYYSIKITHTTVFLFLILWLLTSEAKAQTIPVRQDSVSSQAATGNDGSNNPGRGRYRGGSGQENSGNTGNGSVKQVNSARPDMSKSKGARPPEIVRPSGSRIPKGVGRPAGAGRRGRG